MSSGHKCKSCGCTEIEVDSARGDAVCTNCGAVLEDNIIVAEVQFEEGNHGTSSAIGQFVSADSKGGATKFGASFHVGLGVESREITLKKARRGIQHLCNQLMLNQHSVDTACSFFKMALSRNLTKGRKNTHVHAACVYLVCRTEGTAHLLIDISDILQICCYELGRTYLKLSQALCINIPAMDPCLYILRFAAKLEFGAKTQQVANTALRLVQRMKRDSMHSGRRPSGLCGAALLMAARLHEFGRSANDIVKIVKVHESTLRKRLIEFGDTPSSALTLEEFMTVDLEEDQDPPSFKAARKKDKERLQRLMEEEAENLTDLQKQIELQLKKDRSKRPKRPSKGKVSEAQETELFIQESTLGTIQEIISQSSSDVEKSSPQILELGPNIESMGLANSLQDTSNSPASVEPLNVDMNFDDIDDAEIDMYIMTENEYQHKNGLWHKRNAAYLEEQKIREERLRKEKEEGKPEKKKRKATRRKNIPAANSAGEAIEKIIQEKKISAKINYDVLKCLNAKPKTEPKTKVEIPEASTSQSIPKRRRLSSVSSNCSEKSTASQKWKPSVAQAVNKRNKDRGLGLPVVTSEIKEKEESNITSEEELDDDYYENPPTEQNEMGVLQMLRQHRDDNDESEYAYFDFEEYD
ncbi:hypothetical protein HHI36_016694 [Cryptolaemus montrouzieri]|uniref:B-related factor 1 n=1 Tax=Cryptolaemus montrouzieri TaxID=559131 RepID=A0ABD2NK91_9CUCU